MLKTINQLEATIESKLFRFVLDTDAPLDHIKQALLQFLGYVAKVEEDYKVKMAEQQKEAEAQKGPEPAVEPPKEPDASVV